MGVAPILLAGCWSEWGHVIKKKPDWKQLMWLAYRSWDVSSLIPPKKAKPLGNFETHNFLRCWSTLNLQRYPDWKKTYTNVKIPHEFSVPFWEHPKLGHLFLWCPCSRSLKWGARSWAKDWHKIALFRPIFLYQFGELDDIQKGGWSKRPKKNRVVYELLASWAFKVVKKIHFEILWV